MINHVYQLVSPKLFSVEFKELNTAEKVLVRPTYLAVCHADQRYFQGKRDISVLRKKLPMALIHEACGRVVSDPTGTYKRGQKVVMIPNVPGNDDSMIFENYSEGAGFLSSGMDGFTREFVDLAPDRVVAYDGIDERVAAVTEFISVAVHSSTRFDIVAHSRRDVIAVWGDGSLAYVLASVLVKRFPGSKIVVVGMDPSKLALFSFVHAAYHKDSLPEGFRCDHAFECCGGEGSFYAIDDIIRYIRPQGSVMLMGVSENRIAVNTRDVLEKGLTLVGSSRSGRDDFVRAVELMKDKRLQSRLRLIITEDAPVRSIPDISRVMINDMTNPFKTVFRWEL